MFTGTLSGTDIEKIGENLCDTEFSDVLKNTQFDDASVVSGSCIVGIMCTINDASFLLNVHKH